MLLPSPYRRVRPAISAIALIVTTALLVGMIVFTEFNIHWVTFLAGILVAATAALASRAARADRAAAQLAGEAQDMHEKLAQEVKRREAAEALLVGSNARLQLIDNDMPTMVAFVDREGVYRYHNRAFREGMRLKAEQLTGIYMRDALGGKLYNEVAANVRKALTGETVRFLRTRPDGAPGPGLESWYVPVFTKKGAVEGFFEVSSGASGPVPPVDADAGFREPRTGVSPGDGAEQSLYVETFSEAVTGRKDAADRIVAALEKDEFALLCQTIAPLSPRAPAVNHFEVFVRLLEEEDKLMPPGAFFPLAERFGLLPRLDRWVIQHIIGWASHRAPTAAWSPDSIFFVNVARATLCDPAFPEFVQKQLRAGDVPGKSLCFEITELDAAAERANLARFAAAVRRLGCGLALSGFGRENVSFDSLREFQTDFVKIDGMVVLGLLRNNVYLARVAAISRVAKTIGIRSVAQLVESRDIIEKLREVGVDFAQGIGIAKPIRLRELESRNA
ncbi:MAG TPA: EAL domain-containing protein [Burkholderiales bacterium]|nr:EAL domain-containing protein [Burkholderiales bacterium]